MYISGGITSPTSQNHSPLATDNKSRGLDLLPQARGTCKITYIFEGRINFLLSVSGGITCPIRRDQLLSDINNPSQGWNYLPKAKGKITTVRLLFYCLYLIGLPALLGQITPLSQIIDLRVGIT